MTTIKGITTGDSIGTKAVNDMYSDTISKNMPIRNDLGSTTSIGGETSIMNDVNKNMKGNDIGMKIKGILK